VTDSRVLTREYAPGDVAPAAGTYEQRNVLGSVTGSKVTVATGQTLPTAPRGFTWSAVDTTSD
jgi:hypothetical protein